MINDYPCKICGHLFLNHMQTYQKGVQPIWCFDCYAAPQSKVTGRAAHTYERDNLRYLEELSR